MGLCTCFSGSKVKFDDPPANARFCDAQHALDKVVQQAAAPSPQPSDDQDVHAKMTDDQVLTPRMVASRSVDITSHQIAVSPERLKGNASPYSNGSATDVVQQDTEDTLRTLSPDPVSTQQLACSPRAADTCSVVVTAAADVTSWSSGDRPGKKTAKQPDSGSNKTKSTPTSAKRAPWGSRAAAAQITPVKQQAARAALSTQSSSNPSPSLTRPTCASSARAQATSCSKHVHPGTGTWKF